MRARSTRTSTPRRSTSARSPPRGTSIRTVGMWRGCARRSVMCASWRRGTTTPRRRTAAPWSTAGPPHGCCESRVSPASAAADTTRHSSSTNGARWTRTRPTVWRSSSLERSFSTGRERSRSARPPPCVLPTARPHSETGQRWPTRITSGRPPKAIAAAQPASTSNGRSRSSTSSASCTVRRPSSTTWACAPTTKAPGTRRSRSITAPKRLSGGPATCSPVGMRRTIAPRSSSTRGVWTRRRSCSMSRCAPTGRRSSRPVRRS